ncbi:Uncharacterised protein [Cedecea neteri]|uniref:Uncharacterized protein n=1 Tax=Cedecea neteri TaxID=158822 RepID=A0A2X2SVS6_9ENTR|nr:Uncharacterised protein [Cedecea neteri]
MAATVSNSPRKRTSPAALPWCPAISSPFSIAAAIAASWFITRLAKCRAAAAPRLNPNTSNCTFAIGHFVTVKFV